MCCLGSGTRPPLLGRPLRLPKVVPPCHYDISSPGMPGVTIWSHSLFAWECTPSGTGAIYIYIYIYIHNRTKKKKKKASRYVNQPAHGHVV